MSNKKLGLFLLVAFLFQLAVYAAIRLIIILVTHNSNLAEMADQVVELRDGKIYRGSN